MAKFVIVLACVALFHAATALECYTCEKSLCKEPQEKWQKGTCGKSAVPDQEPVCQKLTYKDNSGNEMVERKCGLAPKASAEVPCPSPAEGATDVKCPICRTDLCNSASSINMSFTTFAGIVLALLSQKYFF